MNNLTIFQDSPDDFRKWMKELLEALFKKYFDNLKNCSNKLLTAEEAAKFLHMKVSTIYSHTHKKTIPFTKKGKFLYFYEGELDAWIKEKNRP